MCKYQSAILRCSLRFFQPKRHALLMLLAHLYHSSETDEQIFCDYKYLQTYKGNSFAYNCCNYVADIPTPQFILSFSRRGE
jgi:hypothetical protein